MTNSLAMRAALPDYLRPVLPFAYYTGCRRCEILAIQWAQVDLLERVLHLEPGYHEERRSPEPTVDG
jgi:integrase